MPLRQTRFSGGMRRARTVPARLAAAGICVLALAGPLAGQEKVEIPDPDCDGSTRDMVECLAATTAR